MARIPVHIVYPPDMPINVRAMNAGPSTQGWLEELADGEIAVRPMDFGDPRLADIVVPQHLQGWAAALAWRAQAAGWRITSGVDDAAMNTTTAAARLGIAAANVRQAIARGTLAAERYGRDWFVEPREIERYRVSRRRA